LPRVYFAVPGDIEARTGGSVYDRKVMEALREDGWRVELLEWPKSFPFPSEACRDEVEDSLAAVPDDALVIIDGLALGVLSGLARREAQRLRLVGLVHHPLALETGLAPNIAAEFAASERDALACCQAVIVTSETTAAIVEAAFGVPGEMITVATPGVDKPPEEDRFVFGEERAPGPVRIFAMGSITPRKAHDVLVSALGLIEDLDWTCVIAGSLERDPEAAEALVQQIADLGLGDRIVLVGEVSETEAAALYADADIFALASVYEGYGMVFAEAQTYGLAIVATTGGAIPEAIHPGAGLLVQPGDAEAFADALRTLVSDKVRRDMMRVVSQDDGLKLPGWDQTAATIAARLDQL
jgi:glycosyltransferase involved in cell wall biosynthesis